MFGPMVSVSLYRLRFVMSFRKRYAARVASVQPEPSDEVIFASDEVIFAKILTFEFIRFIIKCYYINYL